ncbi:MAG: peptidoglycan bridge formation glycyltransferase FemA/FemB family protein [Candidatus Woykebacteria bacterium]
MTYEIKEVQSKNSWENFSLSASPNTFLQSWNWGEFNKRFGRKIWRLGAFEKGKLAAICLMVKYETKFGNYLYCPRGPLLNWEGVSLFEAISEELKKIGTEENCIFIKLDPLLEETTDNRKIFSKLGFQPAVTFVQVEDAWLLPLEKPEEQLLADMRKTTRYLIRNEPKQGVKIEISDKSGDIEKFVDLLYSTADRKEFVNHPKDYYIKQFSVFSIDSQEKIFIAKKGNTILSMAMIMFYGEMGYYLHAASNPEQAQSVGYSLQWAAIKEAKRRGCKYYNFWGVVKDKNFRPGHPWYGFSLFKRGFGGFKYSYLRAQDYPLSPKYYAYRSAERLRRAYRRLRYGYWED